MSASSSPTWSPPTSSGRSPRSELRAWREQVNSQVVRDAGFAYQAYVRLKLASVRAFGAQLIVKLRGAPPHSPLSRMVAEIIDAWAIAKGIVYERADSEALEFEAPTASTCRPGSSYLLAFDVKYRERRLHFLIEGQNRLYGLLDQERFAGLNPRVVDRLKREFYARLDALHRREEAAYYSKEVRDLVTTSSLRAHCQRNQEPAGICDVVRREPRRQDRSADRAARRRDRS